MSGYLTKHHNDQNTRKMRGKKGQPETHQAPPGEKRGMHVTRQGVLCNCGGCNNGVRIPTRVVVL